jgi:rhamnogalacturonyl hydrolase YesR
MNIAIANLIHRKNLLTTPTGIFHRKINDGNPIYYNWARGVAWYLLGLVKSLQLIPQEHPQFSVLHKEFIRAVNVIIEYRDKNGMFYAFLGDKETLPDTSGTAGILAALAFGIKNKLLPNEHYEKILKSSFNYLINNYLTPDGYMRGSTQINNGGEILQRSGYRTISPYTLGFLGIIISCGY